MKLAAIALTVIISAPLPAAALAGGQTDWYSRGIIRQQTINLNPPQKKKQKRVKKKKPKAQSTRDRTGAKPPATTKS